MPEPMRERLKPLDQFSLMDLEAVHLILRGDSVIDWHRLDFHTDEEVDEFLRAQELFPDDASDRKKMEAIKREAIAYLRRHFEFPIPRPIEESSVEELLMVASSRGHRQTCACTILKCMHIIHHVEGRELLFMLPLSDQEIFHAVEEKVYRIIGSMLAHGFPILEFVGGRKNKDSLYTKLLSKQETVAAQIYDKLRFRIVTRGYDDVLPVIRYLTTRLFPFNYVIPGQSINSMFQLKRYLGRHPTLGKMLDNLQGKTADDLILNDNRFSAESYRVIHFVVDMPVRLPPSVLDRGPPHAREMAPVVFVICEFQVIDRQTETKNEQGEASHAKYKDRQKRSVMRRLHLGTREPKLPPPRDEPRPSARPPVSKRRR